MTEEFLNLIPENITEYPNVILRQTGQPLEAFTVFPNESLAQEYAESDLAYLGQQIAIYKISEKPEETKYKYFIVQEDQEKKRYLDPIADLSSLAVVATTGSYNDLLDKPDINNGILTLKASDGMDVVEKTFSANDANNVEFEVKHAVPEGAKADDYGPSAGATQSARGLLNIPVPQITTDEFGHITGVAEKIFTVLDTNTAHNHEAGQGIEISNTSADISGTVTISHKDSGVTSGSYGPTADITQGAKETKSISIPSIVVDKMGHVTAIENKTLSVKDTDTWKANTQAQEGYVEAGGTNYNKVWKTDWTGKPGWKDVLTYRDLGAKGNETFLNLNYATERDVIYYTSASSVVASLVNKPSAITSSGECYVTTTWLGSVNYLVQDFVWKASTSFKKFSRIKHTENWGNWEEVAYISKIPTGVKGDAEETYRIGQVNITPANIGLGNVDNTADADKSVKHAETADSAEKADKTTGTLTIQRNNVTIGSFDGSNDITTNIEVPTDYISNTKLGVSGGVATLDENGHVPSTQLPSYVDDVIEGYISDNKTIFYEDKEKTKEVAALTGKIYVDLVSSRTYRWGGTQYAEISESLALGTTSTTAAAGNHTHTVSHTPAGSVSQPIFTGTEAGHTHSFGSSVSHDHTFTGTTAEHNHTFTGTGTLIKAAFAGTEQTASVSYTPAGTVSTPTITVTPNTATVNSITAVGTLPELTYTEDKASKITKWSAGNAPSLTYTAVEPSKITAWSAGTLPSLTFRQGSLPSASLSDGSASLTGSVSTGPNRTVTLSYSYSNPTLSFSAGSLPEATFSAGTAPSLSYDKVDADNITAWSAGSAPILEHTEVNADDITKWSAGTLPTKGSNTTVVTSIESATASQPSFTGTAAAIEHVFTPSGTVTITTGVPGSGETANYTPAGAISNESLTPAGTISSKTVSISGTTEETKITPTGTVSQPTFTGTAATLTTNAAGS